MTTPTLDGIELQGLSSIRVDKTANIIPLPLPSQDSDTTEVFDLLGVVKILTFTGEAARSTVAATKSFVDSIEALCDGNQDVIEFVSDQTGTLTGMIASVGTTTDVPGFKSTFNIKFIQGKLSGVSG